MSSSCPCPRIERSLIIIIIEERGLESADTTTLSFVALETIERQTEKLNRCLYTLKNLFLLYKIKLWEKLWLLTALTPQTTVVFPSFSKADPSAVDIEPGKIKLHANLSMTLR